MNNTSLVTERFSGLRYPIHKEKGNLLEAFPELAGIPSFKSYASKMKDPVIRYIIYMYDKNSEFIREYRDLEARKLAVAEEVGWDQITINHKKVMKLLNKHTNKMILDFISLQNEMALSMIFTNEQLFAEYMDLLMRPIKENSNKIDTMEAKAIFSTVDIKKKFREECRLIKEELDSLYLEVYGDNWDVSNRAREAQVISISPERVGKLMMQV